MGYEPISGQGLGWTVPDFAGTILKAREQQRADEAQRWSNWRDQAQVGQNQQKLNQESQHQQFEDKRQQQADMDTVHQQATTLYQNGMPLQAEQYLLAHGYHPSQTGMPVGGAAGVPAPQQQPHGTSQQPGNGLMEPAQAGPPSMGPNPTPGPGYEGGGLEHFDVNAASQHLGAVGTGAPIPGEAPMQGPPQPAPQPQPPAPQVQSMVSPPTPRILGFHGPGGENLQIDPMEARRASEEKNNYRANQYLAAMRGTPVEGTAGEFSGLLRAGEDIKPSDLLGLQKAEAAAKLKAKEDADKTAEEMRTKQDVKTQIMLARERNDAIRAAGGSGGELPNPKVISAWESHKNHAKTDALAKNAVQTNETVQRLTAELETGNPYNQATALHSLGVMSMQAGAGSGGRVTNRVMQDIKEATGLLTSAENSVYRATHGGQNMPRIVQLMQGALGTFKQVNDHNAKMAYDSFQRTAGTRSVWGHNPETAAMVSDEEAATAMELGHPEWATGYGDNGETAMTAPAAHAHHGKQGHVSHPPAHAGAPANADPSKTLHLNGKDLYFDASGKAL